MRRRRASAANVSPCRFASASAASTCDCSSHGQLTAFVAGLLGDSAGRGQHLVTPLTQLVSFIPHVERPSSTGKFAELPC